MTDKLAIENDMKIVNIPLNDIYSDADFNVRGTINMASIVDLAKNIDTRGLLQPITIQPYTRIPGRKFRVVVGHRRFAAYEFLDRETIPCIIREDLSDTDALVLNLTENVARQDLNMLEEAHGIDRLFKARMNVDQISKAINKGRQWIKIRQALLTMPEPIQQDAAAGFLTQSQINDLSTIDSPDRQMEIVKQIKQSKLNGERRLPVIKDKKVDVTKCKRRTPEEMFAKNDYIFDTINQTSIVTRTIAWCNGEISSLDFEKDLIEFFKSQDIRYTPPDEMRPFMSLLVAS